MRTMLSVVWGSCSALLLLLPLPLLLAPPARAALAPRKLHRLDHLTHAAPNGKGRLQPMPAPAGGGVGQHNTRNTGEGVASPAHLLQLSGTPAERGHAHGYLLAPQIIDWFVFYQLRANMKGNVTWYREISKYWLATQHRPAALEAEVEAMAEGMRAAAAAGNFSLFVPELGRDFGSGDIYMVNAYLEASPGNSALTQGPFVGGAAGAPACSQFVAWGAATADGAPLAGRNMDGECDAPFHATVHHLIVAAVAGEGEKRFVSVMWPGR